MNEKIEDKLRRGLALTVNESWNLYKYIKALEQQPCENCISREAVLEIQAKYAEHIGATKFWQMRDDIRALPSVTPSRPRGKWILIHPLQEDDDGAYICSNCEHGDWDCDTSYKYCPFCGADMRESEEEE